MSAFEAPIPLSDIESVLAWVDQFKLSRPTKKINRDFSDGVLLAEILNVYYPKLVEMHNYPPRNSHALKLNNWMTLNRKVLRKLKLNLCCSTMEQLSNCAPGVIERVLLMVREKIRRDEELSKSKEGNDQEVSSGGSYYEACGEDEHVLIVPVKSRVNGVLETIQQKVVSHEMYVTVKQELKDVKECNDVLKNKVEHLDSLLKLKEERIDELQKQLERKQIRRKEVEALQNSLCAPFDSSPPTPKITDAVQMLSKSNLLKLTESVSKIPVPEDSKSKDDLSISKSEDSVTSKSISYTISSSNNPSMIKVSEFKLDDNKYEPNITKPEDHITQKSTSYIISNKPSLTKARASESISKIPKLEEFYLRDSLKACKSEDKGLKKSEERILQVEVMENSDSVMIVTDSKHSLHKIHALKSADSAEYDVDRIESNIFKEIEIVEQKSEEYFEDFTDSVDDVVTIEASIKKEVKEITNPLQCANQNYI